MIGSHLKVTLRQAVRHKAFALINLFGLVTGITVCLFIAQFVWFEWSFEDFNPNAANTYRLNLYNTSNGVFTSISPGTVSGLGYAVQKSIPGVEDMARISSRSTGVLSNPDRQAKYLEKDIVYADRSIINILGVDLTEGDRRKISGGPATVIISESMARKYFGTKHALGKVLEMGFNNGELSSKSFRVEGVFRDIPENSHQRFHFILFPDNREDWDSNWAWSNVQTYIVLAPDVKPESLRAGLEQIVMQNHKDGVGDRYLLEPLTSIHLYALNGSGRAKVVYFFILLGGIILLLGWLNYINLSTARFFERMKELGLRKLVGAGRGHLIAQLLVESFFMQAVSFGFAVLLFFLGWPWITEIFRHPMATSLFQKPQGIILLAVCVTIGTIAAGLYPALFLSSFKPLQSLKGKIAVFSDRSTIRKVLVIVQLSITVALLTAVFAIRGQLDYMRQQNLGISIDQTLIIEAPLVTDGNSVQKFQPFKNEIGRLPAVHGVTYASSFPGSEIDWHRSDITLGQENADYKFSSRIVAIGTEFLDVFGLQLITGRNFQSGREDDTKVMLINEKACELFGFLTHEEALNKLIFVGSRRFEIIGVVRNYHFRSLEFPLEPILYMEGYPRGPSYALKISTKDVAGSIAKIESIWKDAYVGNVFSYSFLDDSFEKQYASDQELETVVVALTILAVIIACSGLFGLSLYMVDRRTKEIGIRKVLGATVASIAWLLSRDFIKLILISGVLTIPIVFQSVRIWLEAYAYRMPMQLLLFVIPVVGVMLLVLITVSFQSISAARKNPVESMKSE